MAGPYINLIFLPVLDITPGFLSEKNSAYFHILISTRAYEITSVFTMTPPKRQEAGILAPNTTLEDMSPHLPAEPSSTMINLQKKLERLQVNAETLCSASLWTSAGSSTKEGDTVREDHDTQGALSNITPNVISPSPAASPSTAIKEVLRHLYTISGADSDYPVYAYEKTTSGLVIVSEVLLTEMRRKVEEMGVRGVRAVSEKALALEWGRNTSKQYRRLEKQLSRVMKAEEAAVRVAEGLQASLRTAESERDAVRAQLSMSKEQLYCTEKQRDSAIEDANIARRGLKASLENRETVRKRLFAAQAQVQNLDSTVRVSENPIADVQTATGKTIDNLQICLKRLGGERQVSRERLGQDVKIEDATAKRAEDLLASLIAADEKYQLTKQQLDISEAQMGVLEKQLLTLKSVATTAEEIAMQRMEELQRKNNHLQAELEAATRRLVALEGLARTVKELSSKNAGLANVEADCQIVVEQVNELEHENAGLRSELETTVRKLQESEACSTYLAEQVREYETERQRGQDFFCDSMLEPVHEGTNTSRQGREKRNWSRSLVNLWRSPDGNRDDIDVA